MECAILFLKGIVVGVANVIPGVSGGTMAVVCNVYDRIIALISPNIKKIIAAWKFWLPLALGMVFGIVAFSAVVTMLLERFPVPTVYFFEGLVAGSIPLIVRKVRGARARRTAKIPFEAASFALGLLLMVVMLVCRPAKEGAVALTELTPGVAALVFVAGAAAAVAMIIPGVSGSFLLLALGMYGTVLAAVSALNVAVLAPFALGVLVGLFAGAALVRLLMEKIPAYAYCAILGLVVGSLATIFPGVPGGALIAVSLAAFALGFFAAYVSSRGES